MSRHIWFAVLLAGTVACLAIIMMPFSKEKPRTAVQQPSAAAPAQEQQLKQEIMLRDMSATDSLARKDAQQHLKTMSNTMKSTTLRQRDAYTKKMLDDHQHLLSAIWIDDHNDNHSKLGFRSIKPGTSLARQLETYSQSARKALQEQRSYESPAFPADHPEYFVAAEPAKQGDQGVIALYSMDILKEVQNHQRKNLRLTPYPKEGRYKMESFHPETLKDTTVKTGQDNENASHYYENEIVVTFHRDPTSKDMALIRKDLSCKLPPHQIGNTYIFHADGKNMTQLKAYFLDKWNPKYVEPHYLYLTNDLSPNETPTEQDTLDTSEVPNDILFSEYQWNLPIIETTRGWKLNKGASDVIVAVVDTGADLDHPDLKGRVLPGYNVIAPGTRPMDDVGHGTHVTGIISAQVNNNEGVAGMTWGNKVLPVKALDKSGSGTTYSVSQGIIWAADHGAKVINLSLGNYADAQFLHEAIKYAYNKDIVIVAATGNDNTERPGYPAAYPEVLSVSATDVNLKRASFSNYGSYIDVMAPGESIASTYPNNQYAALSGTSMASPHVAALAGLIRSVNPSLHNTEVMDIIRKNVIDLGNPGRDKYFGYGQIDVLASLKAAGGGSNPLQLFPQYMQKKLDSLK
ncbi:subtilisin family serine protease [Paenibacillus shirakamiensis]|uniref:Subtilisin family serine protease n=1 Tax=Paenibacillus shirakamiensis TaxID=1265935 RepID=A0ABS4JF18_9BACL|nr:S8 family peptidase [Paenibacillus shirakamiensis]MBP1999184.1 subtilisin family serine protease [Paenibacillus shirakamiensis]